MAPADASSLPPSAPSSVVSIEYRGRVAVLTIDNDKKLNALTQAQYYDLGRKMHEVAQRDDVVVTVLTARGRYFSAGADLSAAQSDDVFSRPPGPSSHAKYLAAFAAYNLHLARAFYTHPKVLVAGLNGPAIGLSAAIVALADFVYIAPSAFLLTPFSSLGLVAEGAASHALIARLGPARGNEALIMSRRIPANELVACGFANGILEGPGEFRDLLLSEVDEKLGPHLVGESLTEIKRLIRRPEIDALERHNLEEVFAGVERFVKGVPQQELRKVSTGEKRHKL